MVYPGFAYSLLFLTKRVTFLMFQDYKKEMQKLMHYFLTYFIIVIISLMFINLDRPEVVMGENDFTFHKSFVQ